MSLFAFLAAGAVAVMGGWGPAGHSIVAQIAYQELTPEVRAKIDAILRADGSAVEGPRMPSTLPETASWPDWARNQDAYRWTAPLHYANPSPEHDDYRHERDCPEEGNVVGAVRDFAKVLADESADALERRRALMFVVHFVGDLHQPLHAGRAADRGGNDIEVVFFERERNIHSIWDSGIMRASSQDPWPLWVERLYPEISREDRASWLAPGATPDVETVGVWVSESRSLANEHCYVLKPGQSVGAAYVADKMPIVDERLKQAGVRLGAMLNEILADEP
ncbi:MAG: S1/P1 nuclease [Planctomycetota bacterium]